mmetsp:Transcript_155343/g.496685  ORF Transcript_155343/g.496685 Transcript_155343/m.496685 type:complete len:101 (+) Transcript_155343:3-305(+)
MPLIKIYSHLNAIPEWDHCSQSLLLEWCRRIDPRLWRMFSELKKVQTEGVVEAEVSHGGCRSSRSTATSMRFPNGTIVLNHCSLSGADESTRGSGGCLAS